MKIYMYKANTHVQEHKESPQKAVSHKSSDYDCPSKLAKAVLI